ncbi:MAG TPA: hypothetical protein VGP10_04795, partial [Marisediminicola sp.]|nr:hypothetical protein [Marisediminicola sp.]
DLRGKRIGVPEYHMTAALFAKGMLSDEYGVRAEDVRWVQGGLHRPGRVERMPLDLPSNIELVVERERTIDQMLVDGELDALITAEEPKGFVEGAPGVRRLFPDPRAAELDYFSRTRIFPIMHTLAIRKELLAANPWIAKSLNDAFEQAKRVCYSRMMEGGGGVLPIMLPFLRHEFEATQRMMGDDYWPYGVSANRDVLEAAVRYSHEQGLSKRLVRVEELFAASTLDEHRD